MHAVIRLIVLSLSLINLNLNVNIPLHLIYSYIKLNWGFTQMALNFSSTWTALTQYWLFLRKL